MLLTCRLSCLPNEPTETRRTLKRNTRFWKCLANGSFLAMMAPSTNLNSTKAKGNRWKEAHAWGTATASASAYCEKWQNSSRSLVSGDMLPT